MLTVQRTHEFAASAAHIWQFFGDFGSLESWWPKDGPVQIDHVDVIGEGPGMLRNIYNVGMPDCISERLEAIDVDAQRLTLSIVGTLPAGLISYRADAHLEALDADRCQLTYVGSFTAEPGRESEAEEFLVTVYTLMFAGLDGTLLK